MSQSVPAAPEPSKMYRWIVLFWLSITMMGNYFFYDVLEPLADVLRNQLHFSNENIGFLNTAYSGAAFFTVVIGGFVVDRIGVRRALLLFGIVSLAGAALTAASPIFAVMAIGRGLFGMGAESLIIAITAAVAKWFKGKELSFAFGINLMLARAGSFLAQFSPSWARSAYGSWHWPLVISVGFAALCVVGAIIYWALEVNAERRYELGAGSTDKVVWGDIYKFSLSYWYIVALCLVFYSAIFPFETFAYKFFMYTHDVTREHAGVLVGMLTLFTMFGTPLFGLFSDRVGRRALLMMGGSLLLIPVYLLMAYTHLSLYVPMAMMGIAFALIPAVMWPSVAYIVEQNKLGTAYGLMTMIQNIGLFGFNVLIGWENDHAHAGATNTAGYHPGMWTFSILGFLGLTFAFLLHQRETGPHGHGLETITARGTAG